MFYNRDSNRNSQIHAIIQVENADRFEKDVIIFIIIANVITDYGSIISLFFLRKRKFQAYSKYFSSVIMKNNHFFPTKPHFTLKDFLSMIITIILIIINTY